MSQLVNKSLSTLENLQDLGDSPGYYIANSPGYPGDSPRSPLRITLEILQEILHSHSTMENHRCALAICPHKGLPGLVEGGCLLLVIGASGVVQGGVGGPGTSPLGRAWSEDHFDV